MNATEKLQPLGCGIRIYTSDIHRFGTDAVLLADFAAPKRNDVACDLGTGCGIIPLLWCRHSLAKHITAVDIQQDAIDLLNRSCELNGLGEKVTPICADLRSFGGEMYGEFTLVTMNPPYKRLTGGLISPTDGRAIARHEVTCTVEDAVECASKLLKSGGRLVMCHRPERLVDLICAMRSFSIEPKRLRFVCQRDGSTPSLILCEGKKDANAGMTIDAPFIIENGQCEYSDRMKEIYADYLAAKTEERQ